MDRAQATDLSELRFRMQTITAGVLTTLMVCACGLAYLLATPNGPNRAPIASLFVAAALIGAAVALLPRERIVRSRHRELFFFLWAAGYVAMIAAGVAADGGAKSPFAALFIIPLIFGALSFPLASVLLLGALDILAYASVGLSGEANPGQVPVFAGILAMASLLCAWHARTHDHRRRELSELSRTDPLTGCLNRRGIEDLLEAELNRSQRTGEPLALVILDLDHFKEVNDREGHAAGDELLRWVVQTTHEPLRAMDSLGRLGGDEFAVVLPGASDAEARGVAERITKALAERAPVSVGVASFPLHGRSRDELHQHADADLYAAKHGRTPPPASRSEQLSWAAALAQAVDVRMAVEHDHAGMVASYALEIAKRAGCPEWLLAQIPAAAMLHDVGKISVPERILQKRGPLNPEEWEEIRRHPVTGAELAARVDGIAAVVPWIRHSHEHVDGSGYPDGLRGEEIPLPSRILLVADAFDAMTSDRPYRRALSREEAVAELRRSAGRQFDPGCVAVLEAYLREEAKGEPAVLASEEASRPMLADAL